jgi:hypothetical protein
MSDSHLFLKMGTLSRAILARRPEESVATLAQRALLLWPFLPVTHVYCGEISLQSLLVEVAPPPKPSPLPQKGKKRKQGYAERYRQHWIDKDNGKKSP